MNEQVAHCDGSCDTCPAHESCDQHPVSCEQVITDWIEKQECTTLTKKSVAANCHVFRLAVRQQYT